MQPIRATLDNFDDYFELRCDENNIFWTGHEKAPNYEKLKSWYIQNIQRSDRLFFLFYVQKRIIGYLYADFVNEKQDSIEIGYGVHLRLNGKGYGTKIISFIKDLVIKSMPSIDLIKGWVATNNAGSVRVFIKNGFLKTNQTKSILFKKTGDNVLFEEYIYPIKR
ncbi:GNAT family N-acetyltransferase [Leptospira santarosai]|uniref:GNAT family N-acetyltransferase n=1 Tax=Leptospira santarosai TaxID=28183 RepID=UPI0024AECDB4|nr:GNAT family N-acetyltransferase [Leptospira santarosai]MDI7218269.1 GNAT family N-acetyltransferase [Leptospira santarosai]